MNKRKEGRVGQMKGQTLKQNKRGNTSTRPIKLDVRWLHSTYVHHCIKECKADTSETVQNTKLEDLNSLASSNSNPAAPQANWITISGGGIQPPVFCKAPQKISKRSQGWDHHPHPWE